jgi:hypothetical protein
VASSTTVSLLLAEYDPVIWSPVSVVLLLSFSWTVPLTSPLK